MAEAFLPRSIGELIPKLAASLPEREYAEAANVVSFWLGGGDLMVFAKKVLVNRVADLAPAEAAMKRLDEMLTRLVDRRPEGEGDRRRS